MLRLSVHHAARSEALELLAARRAAPGTSWSPGTTGGGGGRPSPSPHIKPCAFLIPRGAVQPQVRLGGQCDRRCRWPPPRCRRPRRPARRSARRGRVRRPARRATVPLVRLAWGRSGDKGDISNIGLIARRPEWLPLLWAGDARAGEGLVRPPGARDVTTATTCPACMR
jgi:hypothetical protein